LKVQNIHIKPLLKHLNAYNKPCFETAYLSENVKKIAGAKSSPKCHDLFGHFIFSKVIAQLPKKHPIRSPRKVSVVSPSNHCDKFQNYFDKFDQKKVLIGGIVVSHNIPISVCPCKCLVSSFTLAPIFNQVVQSN